MPTRTRDLWGDVWRRLEEAYVREKSRFIGAEAKRVLENNITGPPNPNTLKE